MTFTDQDTHSVIERQKKEIETLTQTINTLRVEQHVRGRAVEHLRGAIEEAVSMANRLATAPVTSGDNKARRHRAEAMALQAYFKLAQRNFESVLSGYPVQEIAERPGLDDISSSGDNVSESA